MRKYAIAPVLLIALWSGIFAIEVRAGNNAQEVLAEVSEISEISNVDQNADQKAADSVHHIVLIELKPTATEADIKQITADAYDLLGQIPGVVDVEVGLKARDNLPIHISDYDLALYLRMAQESDLDVFGPHPLHIEFRNRSAPKWQKIEVLDFFGK
jgi:hypothetical protein